jgi:hypothetical protein
MCLQMILRGIALSDFKIAVSRLYSNAMHAPRGRVVLIDGGGEVPEETVTVGVFAVFFV